LGESGGVGGCKMVVLRRETGVFKGRLLKELIDY
jgi:hypothetical protein